MKKTDPKRAGLFFVNIIVYFWDCKLRLMTSDHIGYTPPEAEFLDLSCLELLAASQSFNEDYNTEYIYEDYGGLI